MTTRISALTLTMLAVVACSNRSGPADEAHNFRLLHQLSLAELGLQQPDDAHVWSVTGWTDTASHREFAIVSSSLSTTFVEVTNPTAPRVVGHAGGMHYAFAEAAVVDNQLYVPDLPAQRVAHLDLRPLLTATGPPRTFVPTLLSIAPTGLSSNASSDRLFIARSGGLQAYDVSSPASPSLLGELALSGFSRTVATTYHGPDAAYQGHELVFGTRPATVGAKLSIVDFNQLQQPRLIAESDRNPSPGMARGVILSADQAYAFSADALGSGLFVADVRDLDAPEFLGGIRGEDWLGSVDDVDVRGAYVYVSNNSSGLAVIDTRQATNGAAVVDDLGQFDTSESTHSVYPHLPSGNLLVAQNGSLVILSPFRAPADGNWDGHITGADFTLWADHFGQFNGNAQPSDGDYTGDGYVTGADFTVWADYFGRGALDDAPAAAVPEPTSLVYGAFGVAMLVCRRRSTRLIVRGWTRCAALLGVVAVGAFPTAVDAQTASGFRQLGALDSVQLGGIGSVTDVRGWVDPLDGSEYAIVGGDFGSAFVDVSEPTTPRYLGFLPNQENRQFNRRTLEVINDHALIGGLGLGSAPLQVFDLTQLRGVATPQTFAPTYSGQPSGIFAFATSASAQTLYADRANNRLEAYDVSNPSAPQLVGFMPQTGSVWDVLAVNYAGPDVRYAGHELTVVANSGRLSIFDYSNREAPQLISHVTVPGGNVALFQVELSPDQRYALTTREDDESTLSVFDLSDLTQPQWLGQVGDEDWGNPELFLQQRGSYSYVTGPLTGLRVFDAASALPSNEGFQDLGFFDTEDYAFQFDVGLPSGSILMANSDDGLVILSPFQAPGDGNWDGHVTGADFTIWADNFGLFNGNAQPSDGDYTGDGYVTGADFTFWADYFGRGALDDAPVAAANIPEPGSGALLGVGALTAVAAIRRRRPAPPRAKRRGRALRSSA